MSIQNNVLGPVPPQTGSDPYGALGNYDVMKTLGHGHFSVVYSARNRFSGVYVALKKVEVKIHWFDTIFLWNSIVLLSVESNGRFESNWRLQTRNKFTSSKAFRKQKKTMFDFRV